MKYSLGVNFYGLQPEMRAMVKVFNEVFAEFGLEPEMSSAADREHGENSWHYFGMAFDVTMKGVDRVLVARITARLRQRIAKPYQLVKEATHWHVECDIDAYPEFRRGAHL